VIPAKVGYVRPDSFEEAFRALAEPEAKILAGGHSLVPMMKLRLARPSVLVDISRLPLGGIAADNGTTTIGALTTWDELARSDRALVPDALREAAADVGDVQVRNRGTLGGGVAHGDPQADSTACVIALGAQLRLRSAGGTRECSAEDFFIAPFTTGLGEQEILEAIVLERPQPGAGSAYYAVSDAASGYPLAGAAVRVALDGGRLTDCTVAITGAVPTPCRLPEVERALLESGISAGAGAVRPAVAELRLSLGEGSPEHRRQLVVVSITRAFAQAISRAQEGRQP
jgi:carbon-monoxide dehydrogenase medium subunit